MNTQNLKQMSSGNPINQDEIQLYLKDIRKIKVMTPEREKELASIIKSEDCTEQQREQIYQEFAQQ